MVPRREARSTRRSRVRHGHPRRNARSKSPPLRDPQRPARERAAKPHHRSDVGGVPSRSCACCPFDCEPAGDDASLMALARKRKLTVYDAAYLELAKREALPLATSIAPSKRRPSPKASPCSGLDRRRRPADAWHRRPSAEMRCLALIGALAILVASWRCDLFFRRLLQCRPDRGESRDRRLGAGERREERRSLRMEPKRRRPISTILRRSKPALASIRRSAASIVTADRRTPIGLNGPKG